MIEAWVRMINTELWYAQNQSASIFFPPFETHDMFLNSMGWKEHDQIPLERHPLGHGKALRKSEINLAGGGGGGVDGVYSSNNLFK